jgi:hypothetical protein
MAGTWPSAGPAMTQEGMTITTQGSVSMMEMRQEADDAQED